MQAAKAKNVPKDTDNERRSTTGKYMQSPRYNRTARLLHWIVAFLVIAQLSLGYAADWTAKPVSGVLLDQHVRVGLLILLLMILRLLWRGFRAPPPHSDALPHWHRRAASTVHGLLYLLMFIVPASGYVLWAWIGRSLGWFGLFPIPILFAGGDDETWRSVAGYTHEYGVYAVLFLLTLHIGAALWHELVMGDRLISERML